MFSLVEAGGRIKPGFPAARNLGMIQPLSKPIPEATNNRRSGRAGMAPADLGRNKPEIQFLICSTIFCNPPKGHNRLHHTPGKARCRRISKGRPQSNISDTQRKLVENPVKKLWKIAMGSSQIKTGTPSKAADRDIMAIHSPSGGIFLREMLFLRLYDETVSQAHPTGQTYLQNQRFLNRSKMMTPKPT